MRFRCLHHLGHRDGCVLHSSLSYSNQINRCLLTPQLITSGIVQIMCTVCICCELHDNVPWSLLWWESSMALLHHPVFEKCSSIGDSEVLDTPLLSGSTAVDVLCVVLNMAMSHHSLWTVIARAAVPASDRTQKGAHIVKWPRQSLSAMSWICAHAANVHPLRFAKSKSLKQFRLYPLH